jgi:hypothetical protein
MSATFIPRGALRFNPTLLDNEVLDQDLDVPHLEKGKTGGDTESETTDEKKSVKSAQPTAQ